MGEGTLHPASIGPIYRSDPVRMIVDEADRLHPGIDRVQARLAVEDVAWDWVDATGDIAPLLEAQSELADLIVLNTALADHKPPDMRATVSQVVMRSGTPILAVPEAARGKHELVADFQADSSERGAGGVLTLTVDGQIAARGRIEHTLRVKNSFREGLDIGEDTVTPVNGDYRIEKSKLTAVLEKVTVQIR